MWILLSSLGWAFVIASVIVHLVLFTRSAATALFSDDRICFQCSGHIRAYLSMVALVYILLLAYHLIQR